MPRRIAVTGIGAVTPVGAGSDEVWNNLLAGRSGIGPVESFDTSNYSVHRGAEIKSFDPAPFFERLDVESVGRASQLAVAAARQAVADAGLDTSMIPPERAGVAMGTVPLLVLPLVAIFSPDGIFSINSIAGQGEEKY